MTRAAKFTAFLLLVLGVIYTGIYLLRSFSRTRTRTFEFVYVTRIAARPAEGNMLRLWVPLPVSDPYQKISLLHIESPVAYKLHRDPEYGNRYAYLAFNSGQVSFPFEVRMRFQTERHEHRVNLRAARSVRAGAELQADLRRFLEPDRLVPTDGVIAALAEQETRGLNQSLDKARAVYDFVVSTMRYDKSGEGWGRGDAIYACNARKGNCTDFHSLFIGMLRASGIPARFEIGFPLPPDQTEGEIPGYHCWAEFFLDGFGWVPVDVSEAWRHPKKREYFFGANDEHRVLFSRGRDIRFNPEQAGEPVNFFVYPYAELDGKPFEAVKTKFFFRDLEL